MKGKHVKSENIIKKIVCMVVVFMMMTSNLMTPVTILASDLNESEIEQSSNVNEGNNAEENGDMASNNDNSEDNSSNDKIETDLNEQGNNDEETNDSFDNLINLFTVPKDISKEIVNFLKKYDKYVEIADESKEEYLIDLTSYIINNKEKYFKNGIKPFLQELKIQMEQKFNIKIYIGKGNNILLASLACLKCFMESVEKNDDSIIINDIKNLFENNTDKLYYLIEVENDEKSILSFLNEFPLEYLSNSENKYFENFNKMINNKNFMDIKTFGDIININYQEIYKIFNKENLYKEIFLFCLGIGDAFHKSQIITNNEKNINEIKEETFKNKNKTQLIKIYIQLANKLFKQIFFYHYNPLTLVIILKTKKNKLYKRVVDKETLFNTYDSIIITGTKIIEQICDNLTENEINDFNKMTIYFDNIVKLDTIDRKIWEELYENEINEIRIKSNKICFWNNFLNSKSKDEEKIQSKSFDNNSGNKSIKETDKKKRTILTRLLLSTTARWQNVRRLTVFRKLVCCLRDYSTM